MKGTGKKVYEMVTLFLNGKMVIDTKENSSKINEMALVDLFGKMELFTMGIMKTMKKVVTEGISTNAVIFMKANLSKESKKDTENIGTIS